MWVVSFSIFERPRRPAQEREGLVRQAKEAATEAKLAIASAQSPQKRESGELAKSAMDPRASRLAAELQLAKERDALRDEVNQLTTLRQKDQQTIKELRKQPLPPPPRAPPPEQRAFQDVERRCVDLERELEDQRAAHEYRIHALRDEFEKLRDAHERKLRAVRAQAAKKAPVPRKAPPMTENTVVGPKKSAGISRQALHAIEEQSRKDHEAKVKAEQKVRSRRPTSVPSLQYESSPGEDVVAGFVFDVEAVRTDLTEMLRAGRTPS